MPNWRYIFEESLADTMYSVGEPDAPRDNFATVFGSVFDELNNYMLNHEISAEEADQHKYKDNEDILLDWQGYVKRMDKRRQTLFGQPLNLAKRSFLVDFFRMVESFEFLSGNVGDTLDISDIETPGDTERATANNYAMDSKSLEWDIVRLVAHNLGLPSKPRLVVIKLNPTLYTQGYWGYVTSGSTESTLWGIWQGFERFRDRNQYRKPQLYLSEASDHALFKNIQQYPYMELPQTDANNEAVDTQALISAVVINWEQGQIPAVLVLNHGTEKMGSVDDIATIHRELTAKGVPHYIHVDASLYGGIPSNQTAAPLLGDQTKLGYDSVGVSMHKYIGYPQTRGVLVSVNQPTGHFVPLIGQQDTALLGMRNLPGFSMRQQVTEVLLHSDPHTYVTGIEQFAQLLDQAGIHYNNWQQAGQRGNMFTLIVNPDKPDYKMICKRWQLAEFVGKDGQHRVQVIIFPYHDIDSMSGVVSDLKNIVG